MTSNIGSQFAVDASMSEAERRMKINEVLRATFRPEFLNRIDDIIIFRSLTISDINRVIDIQIGRLQKMLADRKVTIELTDKAKKHIAKAGYSAVYGARPLKRALQKIVQDGLAMKILEGSIATGDHVIVDVKGDGEVVFERKKA